jgi:hypothetical protein
MLEPNQDSFDPDEKNHHGDAENLQGERESAIE